MLPSKMKNNMAASIKSHLKSIDKQSTPLQFIESVKRKCQKS